MYLEQEGDLAFGVGILLMFTIVLLSADDAKLNLLEIFEEIEMNLNSVWPTLSTTL